MRNEAPATTTTADAPRRAGVRLPDGANRGWLPDGDGGLLPNVIGGVLQGIFCALTAVAFAIFVFAHGPAGSLAVGTSVLLLGSLVLNLALAFGSKIQPVVGGPQDTVVVILAVMVTSVTAALGTRAHTQALPTILVLVMVSSLALGGAYLVLGIFHLGQLIRYLPYPVIGGFLAGAGWLIAVGSFGIMTAQPISGLQSLSLLDVAQVAAALGLAVALPLFQRLVSHHLTMLGTLLAALVVFYLILVLLRIPVAQAQAQGWLLGTMPSGMLLQVGWPVALPHVAWGVILGQSGNIFTLVVINVVATLLNLAGLEVALHQQSDVNAELRVRGVGTLLTGLVGGAAGYDYLSYAVVAQRGHARGRLVPLIAGLVVLATLLGGSALLGLVPRFMLAGMMFIVGVGLLAEWLIGTWSTLPRLEYGILVLITVVIAVAGFFPGVIVGMLAAIVLFVFNYSRTSAIKHDLPGTAYHSTVDRPLDAQRILHERSAAIHVYELQGYIFFGTAYSVLQRVQQRLAQSAPTPLRYAIVDFRNVAGIDSSAAYSLTTLRRVADEHDTLLIFTSLSPGMRQRLRVTQEGSAQQEGWAVFSDVDHALEWCEDQLLGERDGTVGRPLAARLADEMPGFTPREIEERLLGHLAYAALAQGEYLTRQGEAASEIYLIETGRVAVALELPDGKEVRLRVMQPGTLVGELAFYRNAPRTASVTALEPTTCYRVSGATLQAIAEQDPAMVAAFHAFVARVLSERLTTMDQAVAALLG